MPYIKEERRDRLAFLLNWPMENAGDLNYCLTDVCLTYIDDNVKSYQVFNDIIGALECCKQEFYRRMVTPYEDKKIEENGDVYPS